MAKDLAIVLNSGSLNSAVSTALAAQKHRVILIHVDAGGDALRGKAAYDQQVGHFKPYREHTLPMPFLSLLTAHSAVAAQAADPRQTGLLGTQLLSLLPLVSAAARFAGHYQAAAVYLGLRVGSQADELAQATEYVQVWNELLQLPCGQPEVEVNAPLLELEPWQVVDVGYQVNAPIEKTWDCADAGPEPCGNCRGCRSRDAAFQQSGKPDPLRVGRKA